VLKQGEVRVSQYKSLQNKFQNYQWDGVDEFVTRLLISKHVPLQGGAHTPAGSVLLKTIEKNVIIVYLTPVSKEEKERVRHYADFVVDSRLENAQYHNRSIDNEAIIKQALDNLL